MQVVSAEDLRLRDRWRKSVIADTSLRPTVPEGHLGSRRWIRLCPLTTRAAAPEAH
jgi:hypothetical protein